MSATSLSKREHSPSTDTSMARRPEKSAQKMVPESTTGLGIPVDDSTAPEFKCTKDSDSKAQRIAYLPKPLPSLVAVLNHAIKGGLYTFGLSFLIKHGVSVLISLLKRKQPTLSRHFHVTIDTWRFCSMLGSFSFVWKLVFNWFLYRKRSAKSIDSSMNTSSTLNSTLSGSKIVRYSAIAGALAGLVAVACQDPKSRVGYAQQFLMRGLQGHFQLAYRKTGRHIPNLDAMLFILSCGSIMYAYIAHPNTIPREYYTWMVKSARMPANILALNRKRINGIAISDSELTDILVKNKANPLAIDHALSAFHAHPKILKCDVLHTGTPCKWYCSNLFLHVLGIIVPVYGTLNIVPRLVFKPSEVIKSPLYVAWLAIRNTARSSVFLATFITSYQVLMCNWRNLFDWDWKMGYYLFGLVSSSSIFLEHPSRRLELALYCLPKAMMSLYLVMLNRGRMLFFPWFSYAMSAAATSVLMAVYVEDPSCLSPLLFKVMKRLIGDS